MNINQQTFITEYLRSGDKIQAYKNAYSIEDTNYHSLESAANRLLRTPEIANTIQGIQDSIRAEVAEELKAELKQELLTIQQKRALLAQIATGEMTVEQNYRGKNCSQCTQYVKPTINQMLKAIDLDNKLAGHYGNKATHFSKPMRTEKKQPISQQNTTTSKETINEPQRGSTVALPYHQGSPDTDGVIRYPRLEACAELDSVWSFFLRKKKLRNREEHNNSQQVA